MLEIMKNKIALVCTTSTTIETFFAYHIKNLLPHYDITLISNFENSNTLNKGFENVEVINLKMKRGYSILSDFINLIYLILHFYKNNYTFTLSCTPKAGFLCSLSSFIARKKIRVHFFTGQVWVTKKGLEKIFLRFIDKIIAYLSTDLLTDSFSQMDVLTNNKITNKNKIKVLGNGSIAGVNFNYFNSNQNIKKQIRKKYNIPMNATIILFLGRLNKDKGILDLIKVFENLVKKNNFKSLYLFIVGPDEIDIQKYINNSINSFIRLESYTSKPQEFMSASDIFCLPSYREGFGMSAIEAGACNLPVVCSRIYGLTDAVEENITGLMHEPGNIQQIEDCLKELILDPELRNKMGNLARNRGIKYFSQEFVSNQMFTYIDLKISNILKKKLTIVASTIMSVQLFLVPQINILKKKYQVSIITNLKNFDNYDETLFNNCKLIHIDISRGINTISDIICLLKLLFIFSLNRQNLVFSLTPKGGFLSLISSFIIFTPIRIHWFGGQVWYNKKGFMKNLLKFTDKIISYCCTHALTECRSQKEFLVSNNIIGNNNISILGNGSISGVNVKQFYRKISSRKKIRKSLSINNDELVILYLGRLNYDKGILDLLNAFKNLLLSYNKIKLLLVGPDEDNFNNTINSLPISIKQKIHQFPYTNLPQEFMSASDIFCLPSYREGFGMSAIEAGACNLPVVCSRIYGLTDAVEENITGLMHEPGNIQQIEDCLKELILDPELRNKMGENGNLRCRKLYNQKQVVNNFISYIDKVV